MTAESSMRQRIVKLLKPLDALSVENPVRPGTPDINYLYGWIELKQISRWPKNDRVVKIRHFTPQQRNWLRRRCSKGGEATLLLKAGSDWALIWGHHAADYLGREWSKTDIQNEAILFCEGRLDEDKLLEYLDKTNATRT